MREDGFRRVGEQKDIVPGDVVVYRDSERRITHLAIVLEKQSDIAGAACSFRVLSKWGADGEYMHEVRDVPDLLGIPTEFLTERRQQS